jgi:hypothetical protein
VRRRSQPPWPRYLIAAGAAALAAALALGAAPALARTAPRRHAPRSSRAPTGAPLTGAGAGAGAPLAAAGAGQEEQGAGIQSVAGDQLTENGLASPLCKGALATRLSSAAQADCRTSGFVGAAAPSNDYTLDVHIDTGAFGIGTGELLSIVQDLAIAPVWGAVEWLAHAVVVVLEWCYALELLDGASTSTVAGALAHARASFTDPWLALALALASVLALYRGLVRRRVADTLGGALTMLAMMAGGLWVIADPGGTVGAVGSFADQASLGTLAASAGGAPDGGAGSLADSMRALYGGAIEAPWCYLEFGNVSWCDDPARLDPRLRAAALALVAHGDAPGHARELVAGARTNGALFLAFPANGPERNSINREGSLLRAICRGEDATKCSGPAAAEAEFRTGGGTLARALGLMAIAGGALGMALLFGAIALRLLAAAFLGLFLLLLAPFAVLAPAFGDGGRAAFAGWLTRLLGAVASKLVFSFVLGALLTTQRALAELTMLGWWVRWLLISTFWWTVFLKRHQATAMLLADRGSRRSPSGADRFSARQPAGGGALGAALGARGAGGEPLVRRAERALQAYGAIRHPRRWAEAQVSAKIAQAPPREEGLERKKGEADGAERPDRAKESGDAKQQGGGAGGGEARAPDGGPGSTGPAAPAGERPRRPDPGAGRVERGPSSGTGGGSSDSETSTPRERRRPGGDSAAPDGSAEQPGPVAGGGRRTQRAPGAATAPDAVPARRSPGTVRVPPARVPPVSARPARGTPAPRAPLPDGRAPGERTARAPREQEARAQGEPRSRVMEDAFAVAQRRKRQLGFDSGS